MPRLIDADELKREFVGNRYGTKAIEYVIDNVPTVDAEPVRHGRWIYKEKVYNNAPYDSTARYECSECGYSDEHAIDVKVPYCWHCGAKMDEEKENA